MKTMYAKGEMMIKHGSPWDHILPPKRPDLWRSTWVSRKPSRPTAEEESPGYRAAMSDAGRGRLLP
jgi:hypothetical protein